MKQWIFTVLLLMQSLQAVAQTNNYNSTDSSSTAITFNRIPVNFGLISGYSRLAIIGHASNIGNGASSDIWEVGGTYPFLAAASVLEVVSTSANDASAGTGARTVLIGGLDSNYDPITETVTLNGVTPVNTTKSFLRVNLFTTVTSGSGQVNDGDITLRVTGGGSAQSFMKAGYGFGRTGVYTVANGDTLYCGSFNFSVKTPNNTTYSAVFGIQQLSALGNKRVPIEFQVTSTAPYLHNTQFGLSLTQKASFILRVMNTSQASTEVLGAAECILVQNTAVRK